MLGPACRNGRTVSQNHRFPPPGGKITGAGQHSTKVSTTSIHHPGTFVQSSETKRVDRAEGGPGVLIAEDRGGRLVDKHPLAVLSDHLDALDGAFSKQPKIGLTRAQILFRPQTSTEQLSLSV